MRRSLRLLLLEDDPEDAVLFQKRCRQGLAVRHVTTPAQAMAALGEGGFDACFVDYQLGPDSGLDFVRAARGRGVVLPLIVVTGLQIEVLGENALLAGATDFIPKEQLDADTIERTVRWALIRRHVEMQREDLAHAATVAQLMGRVAHSPPPLSQGPSLRRVLYTSVATRPLSGSELWPLCSRFAASNVRLEITGVLIYGTERFLQLLEGPVEAMEILLRRIASDPRHGQMQIVLDEPARRRLFAEWNMGLVRAPATAPGQGSRGESIDVAARVRALLGEPTTREAIEEILQAFPRWR